MKKKDKSRVKQIIINHIKQYKKEYIMVTILFLLGLFIGIVFINFASHEQKEQISIYINNFIQRLKNNNEINKVELLKHSIINNAIFVIILWFAGMSVIGMPIVYGIIVFRGFCFSYTISTFICILGVKNGLLLGISSLLIQSLIFVPVIFAISVSGIKLYKSIIKDRRKENIKIEICRHTFFSLIMSIGLIISSFLEAYVSSNLVIFVSQWL